MGDQLVDPQLGFESLTEPPAQAPVGVPELGPAWVPQHRPHSYEFSVASYLENTIPNTIG
jgi:hypothetical protein